MREMGLSCAYEGLPAILIMDGRVQDNNLKLTGRDERWLRAMLSARGLAPESVYLASLDTQGRMTLQLKDGGLLRFQAMEAREVEW